MDQTTEPGDYAYYFYNLPGGETITGGLQDILQWMEENEHLLNDPKLQSSGTTRPETNGNSFRGGSFGREGLQYHLNDGGGGDVDGNVYHDSSHLRGFVHSANIGTVITVGNIFFNLLLILLVLVRRSLRGQLVYQQVLNLALADLAFSVMVDPFSVYFELQPWHLAQGFCVAWMIMDAALPFVSFLVLILLNVDRLLFAVVPSLYRQWGKRVAFRLLLLFLPWLLGVGVVLPLWMFDAVAWPQPGLCMYGITKKAAVASACLSLYLPCVALIVLTVLVLVTLIGGMPQDLTDMSWPLNHPLPAGAAARGPGSAHVRVFLGALNNHSPNTTTTATTTSNNSNSANLTHNNSVDSVGSGGVGGRDGGSQEGESVEARKAHRDMVVALCVLNLLTVITQLPYGAISLLEPQCTEPECHSTIKLLQSLSWIRSCTFTLHALFLILLLRQVRHTCCRLCRHGHRLSSGESNQETTPCTSIIPSMANSKMNQMIEHMELASIHTDAGTCDKDSSATML